MTIRRHRRQWYRYSCTPGDSKDGTGTVRTEMFTVSGDEIAVIRIDLARRTFCGLGGFIIDETLEAGVLLPVENGEERFIDGLLFKAVQRFKKHRTVDIAGIRKKLAEATIEA